MNDKAKHTSGPWYIREYTNRPNPWSYEIISHARIGFAPIAEIEVNFEGKFQEEQQANARLIAAAPDLLEAIEPLLSIYLEIYGKEPDGELFVEVQNARKAIAKATNEE